jgi:hypothetical protein
VCVVGAPPQLVALTRLHREAISLADAAALTLRVLSNNKAKFRIAVTKSCERKGLWPLNRNVMYEWIARERQPREVADDPRVLAAAALATDKLFQMENLSADRKKRSLQEKEKRKVGRLDTTMATELTAAGTTAVIAHSMRLTKIRDMSAAELHTYVVDQMKMPLEVVMKDSTHFKPVKELIVLVEAEFAKHVAETAAVHRLLSSPPLDEVPLADALPTPLHARVAARAAPTVAAVAAPPLPVAPVVPDPAPAHNEPAPTAAPAKRTALACKSCAKRIAKTAVFCGSCGVKQ